MAGRQSLRFKIVAAGAGNFIEWYDFAIYGFFAAAIGKQFFPSDDPLASLLAAFGVFAVGYGARPLGGVVLGRLADRYGRRPVMLFSVGVMGTATVCIGLLPGYETIGVAAPALLIALRLLQGFSVAGEYTTSTVFLIEHAPREQRGFVSSWSMVGEFFGAVTGSAIGALAATILTDTQMQDWGWRIPFLLSAIFTVVGFLLRRGIQESPELAQANQAQLLTLKEAVRSGWRPILTYVCLILVGGVGFYVTFIYSASDLELHMHMSTAEALDINTLGQLTMMAVFPLAGYAADRIGRKPLAMATFVGLLLFSWPLWWMMHQGSFALTLIGQCLFGLILACGYPVYGLLIAEALPARLRCSVLSIGNGIAYGFFGGMTPLTATYLVKRTGADFAPVFLIVIFAAISLAALLRLSETLPKPNRS